MSIATKRGDGGQTSLAGGIRVSKSSLRVEAYALRHDGVKVTELGERFLAQYPSHPEARRVSAFMKANARP